MTASENLTRVAVVTGGSRGPGRLAPRLGRDGHAVGVGFAGNRQAAAEVAGGIA